MNFSFGTPPASNAFSTLSSKPFSFGTPTVSAPQPNQGVPSRNNPFGSTSLFGTSQPAASTSLATPSLFGSQQQPASTFGFNQPNNTSLLGGGQQQQQQPAAPQQPSLNKHTKFEELPDNERKMIQEIESYINGRKAIEEELKAKDLGAAIGKTAAELKSVSADFGNLVSVLENAGRASDDTRKRFELDLDDICRMVKIVDHFKGTQSATLVNQATHGVVDSAFPFKFFKRKVQDLSDRLQLYDVTINELQGQLRSQDPNQVKAILPTLKAQHTFALTLAAKVANIHDDLDDMRNIYIGLWREKTGIRGTLRDPFVDAGIAPSREQFKALSIS